MSPNAVPLPDIFVLNSRIDGDVTAAELKKEMRKWQRRSSKKCKKEDNVPRRCVGLNEVENEELK